MNEQIQDLIDSKRYIHVYLELFIWIWIVKFPITLLDLFQTEHATNKTVYKLPN